MKKIILVRGCSGSGKTTVGHIIADEVISADDYFMVHGEYKFDPSKLRYAHEQCQSRTEQRMVQNTDKIVVANTFCTEKELQPYLDLAVKYDYQVFSVVVEKRHDSSNVHSVPDEKVQQQANKLRGSIKLV